MRKTSTFENCTYYLKQIISFDLIRVPGIIISALIDALDTWFFKVYIVKLIIDTLLNLTSYDYVLKVIIFAAACKCFKLIYDTLWSHYTKSSNQKITAGFQKVAFNKAAEVDIQCYDNAEYYNNYVYCVNEASSRPLVFLDSVSKLFQTVFTVSVSGLSAILIDPILIIFAIIPILGDSLLRTKMREAREKRTNLVIPQQRKIEYIKRVCYLRDNAIDIRTTHIKSVLKNLYYQGVDSIIDIYNRFGKKFILMYFMSDCFTHVNNTIIVIYLVMKIVMFETLSPGDFVALTGAVSLLSGNLGKVMERFQIFHEHSIYINKYKHFCEYKNTVVCGSEKVPDKQLEKNIIDFQNVCFAYENNNYVIKDITLSIKEGEFIAIVGPNGAGKSTLVKLLLHLYDATTGKIVFRGKELKRLSLKSYLSCYDVVFQEHNNYAIPLSENVTFQEFLKDDDISKVRNIFKCLMLDDLLSYVDDEKLPLTKEFSEDGLVLSGGQCQKVALARALYRDRDVLIMDEPSSALDAMSENKLINNMKHVAKGRTVILISHRLSFVKEADQIIYLDQGKIVESGTHDELMSLQGKYYDMFSIQADAYGS